MTARTIEARGGGPLRAGRRLVDGVRLVVASILVALALTGMAATGTWLGAGAMPAEGPAAGLDR